MGKPLCVECQQHEVRAKGLCNNCYMRHYRAAHPKLEEPNGMFCRCGCGQQLRGSTKIAWAPGHKKAITHCLCGCGTPVSSNAFYVQGHQPRPNNLGRKLSLETRAKMSLASKGKPKSKEHAAAIARAHRRSNVPLKERKKLIRKWKVYRDWRTAVFQRDDFTCQECGARSRAGESVSLEAHHIEPVAVRPDLMFSVANGKTLCVSCHRKTASWGSNVRANRRYKSTRPLQIPLELIIE